MKFGGTSMADFDCMSKVADHIERELSAGLKLAVVVSAMAGETDRLISLADQVGSNTEQSEKDVIISSGEQVSSAILSMILNRRNINAKSIQGWQIPLITIGMHGSARINDVKSDYLDKLIEDGVVPIIAGFQGISQENRVTTLGRGGSDTTAVAIACAINADLCDIYTDVDGVYTSDPRVIPKAQKLNIISFEEMLEMASQGAKVLQTRSVELAMSYNMPIRVRSTFSENNFENVENSTNIGTIVTNEERILEDKVVSGIAYSKNEAKVTIQQLEDKPGVAAEIFGNLADSGINVDMIVQNISADGMHTDLTFTVQESDLSAARLVIDNLGDKVKYAKLEESKEIAKVSIIGVGMRSHAGVAAQMFSILAEKGINIQAITTSEIKVSVLIDLRQIEKAMRALHSVYGLDQN
ncbi:MAG: aspartate kinase [Rhizobiales bacterium TMED28]|nr:aspartate kinase [Rhodobiaceae bacterium]OUT81290.1 MAG: aspartate kinase [Rhizobiales bacterium TMED28]